MNIKKHIRIRKRNYEEFSEREKQAYQKLLQRVEEYERQKSKEKLSKNDTITS